jgi:DNA-binding transcriptional ArsR family regulator
MTLYLPIVLVAGTANAVVEERVQTPTVPPPGVALNAESIFRALGDTTRYAIASILARTPTTSADLARSLNVSKPTITHHVQALRAAGLLSETPEGGSTRLSLREDTVAALSGAAIQQLFASKGDLALATTRKRRS